MTVDQKAQAANAREEKPMSSKNDERNSAEGDQLAAAPQPAKRIYVGRLYSGISASWTEHPGTFDQVVDKMRAKALDGKASSDGFEIVEMTIARSVIVRPVITATEVTETGASA